MTIHKFDNITISNDFAAHKRLEDDDVQAQGEVLIAGIVDEVVVL